MQWNTFVGIVLTALCLSLPARAPADLTAVNSRKIASDFTLTDSKGASVKLSDYKGQVVLLDFWATWCGGCKVEIPWYMEFQNKYKASGLSVIGVSMDEDGWKSVKPFLEKRPVNYPVVIGNPDLAKRYMVDAMPMTLLIDREGKIAASHVGMVDKGCLRGRDPVAPSGQCQERRQMKEHSLVQQENSSPVPADMVRKLS